MKNPNLLGAGNWVFELSKGIILLGVFFILMHFFVITVFVVEGASMEPNFQNNNWVLANRLSYYFEDYQRGDVAIVKFPGDPEHKKYIKRLIGLPGEKITIKNGEVRINNVKLVESYLPLGTKTMPDLEMTLGQDDYFIMGDNRANSSDSRIWGTCVKSNFIGKVFFRIFPIQEMGLTEMAIY